MQDQRQTRPHVTALLLALAVLAPVSARAWAAKTHHAHPTATSRSSRSGKIHHSAYSHGRHARHRHVITGQRVMDPQRAVQIQQALVQAHYLAGSPTGQWDSNSQAAMEKYQADNGWQTKITPDSRALIKLGLGPKQDDGEYATAPSGVSTVSKTAAADPLSTMATSELPVAATQN